MAFNFFKKKSPEKKAPDTSKGSGRYRHLQVKKIIRETPDAIIIEFDQPDPVMVYSSGQFLTLILTIDGKEVRRAYSLCSSPAVDKGLAVTVKRVEGGLVSNWLNDRLKEGDKIKVMEAMGSFTTEYDKSNKRHLILFAGGSGITPMLSIIKSMLTYEPESICSLIYCNRNLESIIFRESLDQLQARYEGRLRVIHVLDDAPMNWQGHSGLLNHDMLIKIFERLPDWGIDHSTYLMCGPEGMMKNVQNILVEQRIPEDKIFKESFVAGTIDKELKGTDGVINEEVTDTKEVKIIYDGEEHIFSVSPGKSILETALDLGIDLPYSCQSGLCTACRGKCISGKVKLDEEEGLSEAELEEGYVLTCVGHPLTDDVIIEIG